jgi:LmbE family N-acetylglucosaminyl deacetylase
VRADEAVSRVADIVAEVRPDTVLTFGPDGMTWHADHIAVGQWTASAVSQAGGAPARLLYATKTPEWGEAFLATVQADEVMMADQQPPTTPASDLALYVDLQGDALDRKYKALLCQPSQVESLLAAMGDDVYRGFLAEESFRSP